jgi:hypothetical protein
MLIDSPIKPFINVIGLFGCSAKGLLVYAPLLIPSIHTVPRAFRTNREVATYALLLTTCVIGFLTLLKSPTDETSGCRYVYLAIALQILCIGATSPQPSFGRDITLVALALIGVLISFLRASYYYGLQDFAAKKFDRIYSIGSLEMFRRSLNLRNYCQPQLLMVRSWRVVRSGVILRTSMSYVSSVVLGAFLLGWVVLGAVKEHESEGNT